MPLYRHDCDRCKFLGTWEYEARLTQGSRPQKVDLYHCPASSFGGSVIARFGSDGPDYASMAMDILERVEKDMRADLKLRGTFAPALFEAADRLRAEARNE